MKLSKEQLKKLYALKLSREGLIPFAKLTYRGYAPNWHHRVLADKLMELEAGESGRLMVLMPPRHGKSELASVRFPAWFLGRSPQRRVIATSYSARLAENFGRKVRDIVADEKFRLVFGSGLSGSSKAADRWETSEGGGYVAAGVGGSITGMGGDLLIVDDPFKNQEDADSKNYRDKVWDWYQSTLYTRIEKGGRIVVILTRWHEDDLAGRLLADGGDQWDVVSFPAIAEEDEQYRQSGEPLWAEKYDLQALDGIKGAVGTRVWNALYQQRPAPDDGAVFKKSWFRFYDVEPEFDQMVQSWDMTFSGGDGSDFVVGQVWGIKGAGRYLLDQVRGRMDFMAALHALRQMTDKYPAAKAKYIEDKANGPAVISALKSEIQGLIPVNPKGSKVSRAIAITPMLEAGNVYLRRGAQFTAELMDEAALFPSGKNDDMVDAMTQALSQTEKRQKPSASFAGLGRQTGQIFKKY
jgi:predicted phage terminase large subunit-like protein